MERSRILRSCTIAEYWLNTAAGYCVWIKLRIMQPACDTIKVQMETAGQERESAAARVFSSYMYVNRRSQPKV